MKLSRNSEYAYRTMIYLAVEPERRFRVSDIAKANNMPINHLVKVISHLEKKGYVATFRGRSGGVSLGKPADSILVGELISEMDHLQHECGECLMRPKHGCPIEYACLLSCQLEEATQAFYTVLNRSTLAQHVEYSSQLHDTPVHPLFIKHSDNCTEPFNAAKPESESMRRS